MIRPSLRLRSVAALGLLGLGLLACDAPARVAHATLDAGQSVHTAYDAAMPTASTIADAGADDATGPTTDAGLETGAEHPLAVFDLHVDLGWAAHTKSARLGDPARDASLSRLLRGEVGTLVIPLYVSGAYAMPPAEARREYERTFADAAKLFARDASAHTTAMLGPAAPGKIRLRVSFEGADGFVDDIGAAEEWVRRGVCLFGLVHSRSNALGGASQDPTRAKRKLGLTAKGKELAERLVRAGAVLDVAHASDTTADDLLAIAEAKGAPVVDSHTGARALVAIDRNLDDARIVRVARTGGIVSLSIHSGHISSHRGEAASFDDVVAHLEHLLKIAGEDHVAIGSDLEGDILMPSGVDGAAVWPELARRLASRGTSRAALTKLFHANADRVFSWAEAHGCGGKSLAK